MGLEKVELLTIVEQARSIVETRDNGGVEISNEDFRIYSTILFAH
jgi:hypothetical protein